ncbi:uncharacterized protein EDB93DRAFT_569683 [Suillus bovinus]|uniref:uncharacterized protein n=1 Tax=Suillus bovinus TaxID=48563 RepID=UPI001B885E3C|nr:uncharacterized protein EDB93DRAFT_569683 [Suillus bovinus]KAG2143801.1 hypothetical protein EDB93DRAFT_569683 [Suillus bovinus]
MQSQPITPDIKTQHSNDFGAVNANGQRLVDKQDKFIHFVSLHEELGPAVSRLPVELLSEIFIHTLAQFDELLPPSKLRSPMLLTRICRRWREVAVGTPGLWCRLFSGFTSTHRMQQEAFCYDTWLKRSQGLPLLLAVTRFPDLLLLTGLLEPYMNQISSLHIVCYFVTRKLLLNDLPALQVLTMDGYIDFYRFKSNTIAESILKHSFTLRSLKISAQAFYFVDVDPFKNTRWPHLTHVEITVLHQNIFLALLQQAPNLSSAKIMIFSSYNMPPGPTLPAEPFTHENLQFLDIECNTSVTLLPDILNALSLSNLRHFRAAFAWTQWPHEEFEAFLVRSECPLEYLEFGDGKRTMPKLIERRAEYFALIPSLVVHYTRPS